MQSSQELDILQVTLNKAIDAIREELLTHNLPSLTTSAHTPHPLDDPHFIASPRLFEARKQALGSMGQLQNLLQVPFEKVLEQSLAIYDTACMDIVIRTGVLDMISDHPSTGCSITDISSALSLDPRKLTTILRYLAAQGWLLEKSQDNFCLSRAGLELRWGQNGRIWALTPRTKVAGSLFAMVTHSEWKMSSSPLHTAFQLAFETDLPVFEYLQQYPLDMEQWSGSVRAFGNFHQRALMEDYPWEKLTPGRFVDCGGGQGYLSVLLAKRFHNSSFVIQDLPEMVPIAHKNILRDPAAASIVHEGRLLVEGHDFFQPQPRAADVYIFKHIMHDWPDSACVTMLENVVKAGVFNPNARILIIDFVAFPSTYQTESEQDNSLERLNGSTNYDQPISPPMFMPANFGAASKAPLALGVHMLGLFNACERTLPEWESLIAAAGLVVENVKALRANTSVIECKVDPS
ncbi:S-adenosyl-L-methionine-dependent methyltransferase [Mycena metata]|uniref:S-adenosyl-L-methionine-dependent methyltransferase n=1 Tax=Mycena metata TaxID=1033252 RepID=A0AAD7HH01_9AGAR|nr:S-adenosyl-L-methionine-dependent methyltransferase [Mycena metata]